MSARKPHQVKTSRPEPPSVGQEARAEGMAMVVDLFHDYMAEFYSSEVQWSAVQETPIVEVVRRYFDDVLRRAHECVEMDPEQRKLLGALKGQVMNYVPEPSPKWVSCTMLDYRGREGREYVLRRERHQLAERLGALLSNTSRIAMPTGTVSDMEKIKWLSTTSAFCYIMNTLAQQGYIQLPTVGGKENDANITAFARILLKAFHLGEGEKGVTVDQLRIRLSEGGPRPLAKSKAGKFQIPEKGELVIPPATEMR